MEHFTDISELNISEYNESLITQYIYHLLWN